MSLGAPAMSGAALGSNLGSSAPTTIGRMVPETVAARAQARGRWPFAFGSRFFVLLVAGLAWLGPSFVEPRFLWAMAAWDILLVALWALDLTRISRPSEIELARVWSSPPALATRSSLILEIRNHGAAAIQALVLDETPAALRRELAPIEIASEARGVARGDYDIRPDTRGDVRMGKVFLRVHSALRIAERWMLAELPQTVRIYPNLEESKRFTLYLTRSRQIETERRLVRQLGRGRDFDRLREYRDGDEKRDVCWTATARRGKLITRVHRVERNQVVWLVIDTGRLMRARIEGLSKLDFAVDAALALAHVASHSGDRVGLLAYGRAVRQRLAPARGRSQLRAMMEALALVRSEPAEADHLRAAETLLSVQRGRSLVFWLTDVAESAGMPEVVELASRLSPPHLLVFGVIGEPALLRLVSAPPTDASSLYRYVAGEEVVQRRELLLRRLRERGALAMEVDPRGLSSGLVNRYLEVKERSLL